MPQISGNEIICHKIYIKDLWAEKINSKQLEFNATVLVCGEVMRPTPFRVLTNPAFEESSVCREPLPMVIYVCKQTDTLWYIAKNLKHRWSPSNRPTTWRQTTSAWDKNC